MVDRLSATAAHRPALYLLFHGTFLRTLDIRCAAHGAYNLTMARRHNGNLVYMTHLSATRQRALASNHAHDGSSCLSRPASSMRTPIQLVHHRLASFEPEHLLAKTSACEAKSTASLTGTKARPRQTTKLPAKRPSRELCVGGGHRNAAWSGHITSNSLPTTASAPVVTNNPIGANYNANLPVQIKDTVVVRREADTAAGSWREAILPSHASDTRPLHSWDLRRQLPERRSIKLPFFLRISNTRESLTFEPNTSAGMRMRWCIATDIQCTIVGRHAIRFSPQVSAARGLDLQLQSSAPTKRKKCKFVIATPTSGILAFTAVLSERGLHARYASEGVIVTVRGWGTLPAVNDYGVENDCCTIRTLPPSSSRTGGRYGICAALEVDPVQSSAPIKHNLPFHLQSLVPASSRRAMEEAGKRGPWQIPADLLHTSQRKRNCLPS
ncbi:hypothetical protein BDV96DRAFT_664628 [Lophiotrema nucula]|uniref:Uncharacterized protein n=1 Tax=Lophiotrema nucula TaxID=690887 RepID=A0A6A5YZH6_9PLEO|nr:hypothetical protein BDV96DRAFT_664628 [Lophiotrema nucula]